MGITTAVYLVSPLLLLSQGSARYLRADAVAAECFTNRTYTAVSGDTCASIARAHSVPRGSLVWLNDVRSDCGDLRVGQILCLPDSCELSPVSLGATCTHITEANAVSMNDLFKWNRFLDPECMNLRAGDQVCIAAPRALPTPTTTLTTAATTTVIRTRGYSTATVAPPGPVPRGTTAKCGEYYQVKSGEYCDSIADRFSIDLGLFRDINPAINEECTNLVPGLYYCVSPTLDWNQTTTTTLTSTYATAPAPTTSGTTPHCYEWYVVRSGDSCNLIASLYGITVRDIRLWNPSLREDCSNLRSGLAYCIHGDPEGESTPGWILAVPTADATPDDGKVMLNMME